MSDQLKTTSVEEQAKRLSDLRLKEIEVKNARIDSDYEVLQKKKKEAEAFKNLDIFSTTDQYVERLHQKHKDRFKSASKKMHILSLVPQLSMAVPFYAGELFLMMARTGTGKTTACRNIAYSALLQGKKPVVITNEESAVDFINGLSALFIGKRYGNLEKIDQETKERLDSAFTKVAKQIKVIDADYATDNGVEIPKVTNTIEGLEFILNKLLDHYKNDGLVYDEVIIDYYQKFNESIKNPKLTQFECQEKAANLIEGFRHVYPAPVVLFCQLKPMASDEMGYEDKIQGRKVIANFSTVIIEMIADRKNSTTEFKFHKGRNMDYTDGTIKCGWDAGKFVEYDDAFRNKVLQNIERKEGMHGKKDESGTSGAVAGDSGSEKPIPETGEQS